MPRVPLPLGFSFYQSESKPFSAQRCINWIPTVAEGQALNPRALLQPSGLKQFADTEESINRGAQLMGSLAYFVYGSSLFSVSSTGVTVNLGTIPGTGRVSLAHNAINKDNSDQFLVIVIPGVSAFVFNAGDSSLTQITDPDFVTSDTVVFKGGFFVFSASDGSIFFNSLLNQPLSYDSNDQGSAEISPDLIVALHVNHDELFVGGEETIELFQIPQGTGAGFPFQRIPGANIQKGVHAKHTIVEFDNTFVFAGGGRHEKTAIWKVSGSSSAIKISTDAIDNQIQKFNEQEIKESFALTWAERGQFLASFTFESTRIPSKTFVYNATASALSGESIWFEQQSGVTDNRFRVQSIVRAYGKLLVGDQATGLIGELDQDTLTYYGEPIFRQSTTAPFSADGVELFAGLFEATFQAGVGLTSGLNPQVRLADSDDGGHTFDNERSRGIGKIGKYGQRAVWERQGSFPVARVVQLTITDPVVANLIRLAATPEAGTNG